MSTQLLVYVTLKTAEWSRIAKVSLKTSCITYTHFNVNFVILDHSTVFRVTYTKGRIDTIDSSDDEHLVARNM